MIFINTAEFLIFSRAQSPLSRTARMKQKIRPENTSRILSPAFGITKQGIGILGKKNFFQIGRGIWIGRILKLIQRFLINSNILSCIYNWTCLFFLRLKMWWMLQFSTMTQSQNTGISNAKQVEGQSGLVCREHLMARNISMNSSWNTMVSPSLVTRQDGSSLILAVIAHQDTPFINYRTLG